MNVPFTTAIKISIILAVVSSFTFPSAGGESKDPKHVPVKRVLVGGGRATLQKVNPKPAQTNTNSQQSQPQKLKTNEVPNRLVGKNNVRGNSPSRIAKPAPRANVILTHRKKLLSPKESIPQKLGSKISSLGVKSHDEASSQTLLPVNVNKDWKSENNIKLQSSKIEPTPPPAPFSTLLFPSTIAKKEQNTYDMDDDLLTVPTQDNVIFDQDRFKTVHIPEASNIPHALAEFFPMDEKLPYYDEISATSQENVIFENSYKAIPSSDAVYIPYTEEPDIMSNAEVKAKNQESEQYALLFEQDAARHDQLKNPVVTSPGKPGNELVNFQNWMELTENHQYPDKPLLADTISKYLNTGPNDDSTEFVYETYDDGGANTEDQNYYEQGEHALDNYEYDQPKEMTNLNHENEVASIVVDGDENLRAVGKITLSQHEITTATEKSTIFGQIKSSVSSWYGSSTNSGPTASINPWTFLKLIHFIVVWWRVLC